jgi:hypothetical protein
LRVPLELEVTVIGEGRDAVVVVDDGILPDRIGGEVRCTCETKGENKKGENKRVRRGGGKGIILIYQSSFVVLSQQPISTSAPIQHATSVVLIHTAPGTRSQQASIEVD